MAYKLIKFLILIAAIACIPLLAPAVRAATYTVSSGQSIQSACLDTVRAGDRCTIQPGTYHESLTLKTSGTSTAPITIQCAQTKACTINSGDSKTIATNRPVNYYIFDGLRFLSSSGGNQSASSLTFDSNQWISITDKTAGVTGHILRNCYIEGSVYFFGSHNLVENCELNGKSIWTTGISEKFGSSHDNTFRNNTMHDYLGRGIWSMQHTDNTRIEGNTIHDTGQMGIDCDGAGNRVDRCLVRNNTVYNISGEGVGILLENAFHSEVSGNTVSDSVTGISIINYGKSGNYDGTFHADDEYRNQSTHTVISGNTINNMRAEGIMCHSAPGVTVTGNSISRTNTNARGYFAAISLGRNGDFYCRDWTITDNTLRQTQYAYWFEYGTYTIPTGTYQGQEQDASTDLGNLIIRNNSYDFTDTAAKYHYKVNSSRGNTSSEYTVNFTKVQENGYEQGSVTSDTGSTHPTHTPTPTATPVPTPTPTSTPTSTPTPSVKPGDATGDNVVNTTDLDIWKANYGKAVSDGYRRGDFNNSRFVDGIDYVIWLMHYGT